MAQSSMIVYNSFQPEQFEQFFLPHSRDQVASQCRTTHGICMPLSASVHGRENEVLNLSGW